LWGFERRGDTHLAVSVGFKQHAVERLATITDVFSRGAAPENEAALGEEVQTPGSNPRYFQMFPTLTDVEIVRVSRFGAPCCYAAGQMLYSVGGLSPGMFVLLSGAIRYLAHDGPGRRRLLRARVQRGEFTSDIGMLSGKPALVDAQAIETAEALVIPPERLRALMIAKADLGERIMRTLILRRVALIEHGKGVVLVAAPDSARLLALQYFLRRNGYPHMALDVEDADAITLLERLSPRSDDLPLVVCPDGTVLRNPDERQLASCLGVLLESDPSHIYDVAIVGVGPAGLAAAVYAASEGLSVAAFDCRAPGGQAGKSARIENYLGFPTGISGARACRQGVHSSAEIRRAHFDFDGGEDPALRALSARTG